MNIEHIIYNITNKCNLLCGFCHKNIINVEKSVLEPTEIEKIFSYLHDIRTITITGGEPFLYPDVAEFFKYISDQKCLEELTVSTNGTFDNNLFKSLNAFLQNNKHTLLRIRVSIHGFQEYHEGANGIILPNFQATG